MRKTALIISFFMVLGLCAGYAGAQQVNNLNEPGSLLVFPLMDNINYSTIIEIANRAATDVWLEGYVIAHTAADPTAFVKKDFIIHVTQKEPFLWFTNRPYSRTDAHGVMTQIPSFAGYKGFVFVFAIDDDKNKKEIQWNFLKGDALLYGGSQAFQYNAIPSQRLTTAVGDRVLNLDGVEYTRSTSQIMFEGFASGYSGISGILAVCNLDIDFIQSIQPQFDINFECWNQNEVAGSRHKAFKQFAQYSLYPDLNLGIAQVFTPKFQCATTSTHPLWAIFYQWVGNLAWGGNVWQHPATGVSTAVVLPPVPLEE